MTFKHLHKRIQMYKYSCLILRCLLLFNITHKIKFGTDGAILTKGIGVNAAIKFYYKTIKINSVFVV